MIPILYEKTETSFLSNGLGRLRDCISCIVTEERNGIFECDFEYPISGVHYELIQLGRIIGVTHDDTGDIQPFDIVSYSRPINGVVTFHAVHISYRQSYLTVTGSNINSLADAFTLLESAEPSNPFAYTTDKASSGYLAAADGTPRTVRSLLGGVEGSILDAYGGEYKFDKFSVGLLSARGRIRDFTIRYGVNMLDYNEEGDASGTYSSVIPYWTDGTTTIIGDRQDGDNVTVTGRGECVPLDVSDKFENAPTKAQVEAAGLAALNGNNTALPTQNIKVSFVRLQDMGEYAEYENLLQCELCDTIKVVFPGYNTSGNFKIVKTVWDALEGRFDEMELGALSTTLAEALGIDNSLGGGGSGGNFLPLSGGTLTGALAIQSTLDVDGNTTIGGDLIVNGHSSAIGSILSANKSVSTPNANINTWVSGPQVTLTPGTWVLVGNWHFASNGNTTARQCAVRFYSVTDSSQLIGCYYTFGTSYATQVPIVWVYRVTANKVVRLDGANSIATSSATNKYIQAVRIA